MSTRNQDYQKETAVGDLWDNDGMHTPKKHRNKGKGRGKDKKVIAEAIKEYDGSKVCGDDGFICDSCREITELLKENDE